MSVNPNKTNKRNPYSILNLSTNTTQEEIQKSYKYGSRYFHPDKNQTSSSQEIFIEFKNAYDILSNPITKLIYDKYGYQGIELLRTIEYKDTYKELDTLYKNGCGMKDIADLLDAIILEYNYKEYCKNSISLGGNVNMECSMINDIQYEKTEMTLNVDIPIKQSTFIKLGHTASLSSLHVGKSSNSILYGMELVPFTDITLGLSIDNNITPTLSSTRMLHDNTPITIQLHGIKPVVSIFSHRVIFQKVLADVGLGFGRQFHFMRISFTTLLPKLPQLKVMFNAGVYPLPITISIKHYFSQEDCIHCSLHTNFTKIAFDGYVKRKYDAILSKLPFYVQVGVRQTFSGKIQAVFKLYKSNGVIFSIPVTLIHLYTEQYLFKVGYLSFMMFLVDQSIQDILSSINSNDAMKIVRQTEHRDDQENERQNNTLLQSKTNMMTKEQQSKMKTIACNKQSIEKKRNGLIILHATYYAVDGKTCKEINSLDVTIPIQFYVTSSTLNLPNGSKSQIMGFCDITTDVDQSDEKVPWYNFRKKQKELNVFLKIRYVYDDSVYEVTKGDDEEIHLPFCNDALLLGNYSVIS